MERGIIPKKENQKFVTDCTIETDQPALIPDDYINITAEKIRIYKTIDSMVSDKEIDRYSKQIEDRFGKLPLELVNLFNVLKIRNIGSYLGFEKIIIKNGLLIAFFISNPMSPYYKTKVFETILERVGSNGKYEMKQSESKLKIIVRNVTSLSEAKTTLSKLR